MWYMWSDVKPAAVLISFVLASMGVMITAAYYAERKVCMNSGEYRTGAEYHDYDIWSGCWLLLDDGSVVNRNELRREE